MNHMWVMVEGSTSHTQIWAKRNICTDAGACMKILCIVFNFTEANKVQVSLNQQPLLKLIV